jgi:hypothetical protein
MAVFVVENDEQLAQMVPVDLVLHHHFHRWHNYSLMLNCYLRFSIEKENIH